MSMCKVSVLVFELMTDYNGFDVQFQKFWFGKNLLRQMIHLDIRELVHVLSVRALFWFEGAMFDSPLSRSYSNMQNLNFSVKKNRRSLSLFCRRIILISFPTNLEIPRLTSSIKCFQRSLDVQKMNLQKTYARKQRFENGMDNPDDNYESGIRKLKLNMNR